MLPLAYHAWRRKIVDVAHRHWGAVELAAPDRERRAAFALNGYGKRRACCRRIGCNASIRHALLSRRADRHGYAAPVRAFALDHAGLAPLGDEQRLAVGAGTRGSPDDENGRDPQQLGYAAVHVVPVVATRCVTPITQEAKVRTLSNL